MVPANDAVNRPFFGIYINQPKYSYSNYLSFNFWPIQMPKIQFDVSVANGVANDVANDVQIYFLFSEFKNTPCVLTCYKLKLSSTK